jgi:iron complex transport system substrate-binding protein
MRPEARLHPMQLLPAIGVIVAALSAAGLAPAADNVPKPQRIVSMNLCTDELVLRLADRRNISSVTWQSRNRDSSNVADLARDVPINHGVAEEILPLNPDLVLAGIYTTRAPVALLKRAGMRVVDTDVPRSFEDVRQQYREIAALFDQKERGEQIIAEMDSNLARLERDRPPVAPTAIVLHGDHYTYGRGSIIDVIMTRAGLENVAVRLGIGEFGQVPLEIIAMNPVDVLIFGSHRDGPPALATELLRHPVLSRLSGRTRVVVIPDRLWNCGGPPLVEAVERLMRVAKEVRGKVPNE